MRKLLAALIGVAAWASSPAQAAVVFGNLGSDGSGALGPVNEDIRPSNLLAQVFTTGSSSLLSLESITLGLFALTSGTTPGSIGLYTGTTNAPGTLIYTSTNPAIGNVDKYTFAFPSLVLATNQTYWVMPDPDLSWYRNSGETTPTEQNGSGYSYVGTLRSTDAGSTWTSAPSSYSISIQSSEAVPEPGTWAAAILLCGAAAWAARRRRAG